MHREYEFAQIQVASIFLDQENPRFPPTSNQRAAIEVMLSERGRAVATLAGHIYRNGLNPSTPFIIFKDGTRLIDADGNRRLTAIKLLETPALAKSFPKIHRKIKTVLKSDGVIPSTIHCVVFNDRLSANHWIELNHSGAQSGVGHIKWSSEAKDRFLGTLSIGLQAMERLASVQLFDINDKKSIHKTTLDRVLKNRFAKTRLQITNDGPDFSFGDLESLAKVVNATRGIAVKQVYDAADQKKFIESILDDKETGVSPEDSQSSAEAPVMTHITAEPVSTSQNAENPPKRRTRRVRTRETLLFGQELSLKSGNTNNLYRDLEHLYNLYLRGNGEFSEDFVAVIRMGLRLLVETAADPNLGMAGYVNSHFDKAKATLSKDGKTTLSAQAVTKSSLVKLLNVGAHDYDASKNREQTVAMSLIIGAMLSHTHGRIP